MTHQNMAASPHKHLSSVALIVSLRNKRKFYNTMNKIVGSIKKESEFYNSSSYLTIPKNIKIIKCTHQS